MDSQSQPAPAHAQQSRSAPVYDPTQGGHYGACASVRAHLHATQHRDSYDSVITSVTGSSWLRKALLLPSSILGPGQMSVHQGLTGQYKDILTTYWQQTITHLESDTHDYKIHQLPLARIKKVMKADPEVKMISAEAPILFAKGCDIFITELTMRAWIHAEENKRRTLQRSDIASALAKSDMFDFLIDIVPREEASSHAKRANAQPAAAATMPAGPGQTQLTSQHGAMGQNHSSHQMGPSDYMTGHHLATEHEYRQNANMYPSQVPQSASATYGQTQASTSMYGEMEGMYPYAAMQPQQAPMSSEEFE
ncbi:hypothetical protein CP532_1600 [Ophiocordyceps camponoti-leonardi (nom. inval.)]|nr:hypothetical protein CP532_1600 [Ophiocordyceps camponoti-leonardi (nom. inval.)]